MRHAAFGHRRGVSHCASLRATRPPPVQATLQAIMVATQATLEWFGANAQIGAVTMGQMGPPGTLGGFSKAPFDFLGDSLRGTRAIMMDLFLSPGAVLDQAKAENVHEYLKVGKELGVYRR